MLDASVILAIVNREPGHEKLTPQLLSRAVASTVNLAEVHNKLLKEGWDSDEAWNDATGFIKETAVFDEEHARLTGDLSIQTRTLGLSLGDRACLALGIMLQAPIYTAERTWKNLQLNVRIHVIR
ncbi:MAG TPA: type II toxin-antitoxin system VapC family toxin [Terriglobales bacterium]